MNREYYESRVIIFTDVIKIVLSSAKLNLKKQVDRRWFNCILLSVFLFIPLAHDRALFVNLLLLLTCHLLVILRQMNQTLLL